MCTSSSKYDIIKNDNNKQQSKKNKQMESYREIRIQQIEKNKQMIIDHKIRIENITQKYSAKVEQINKEVYEQLSREKLQEYVKLELDNDNLSYNIISYMKMFVPFKGYTHIAKYYDEDEAEVWSYARELTAEEKKNAPEGCDWEVDGKYATLFGTAFI